MKMAAEQGIRPAFRYVMQLRELTSRAVYTALLMQDRLCDYKDHWDKTMLATRFIAAQNFITIIHLPCDIHIKQLTESVQQRGREASEITIVQDGKL